jgi:hypothetical protein
MQTHGLIVADNGSDLYVTGAMDARWDNGMLTPAFHSLTASDFEVLQLAGVIEASSRARPRSGARSHASPV